MPALIYLFLLLTPVQQDQGNFWHILAEVSFEKKKDPRGYDLEVPNFSKHLQSFKGKKVTLKGYLIPLNEVNGKANFMFSSLPFNVCYFCGAAGPETVVELDGAVSMKFTTKAIIVEGILNLNDKDPDHHMYILKSPTFKSI